MHQTHENNDCCCGDPACSGCCCGMACAYAPGHAEGTQALDPFAALLEATERFLAENPAAAWAESHSGLRRLRATVAFVKRRSPAKAHAADA